jgi:uncharacterized protein YjbI with pentapeptide repeats
VLLALHSQSSTADPAIRAAWIATGVSLLTLIVTTAMQIYGARRVSKDTRGIVRDQLAEERLRTLNERFATAADRLGTDRPAPVRLAAVYAMAGLADDWPENRQTCVDVLCAYLRMPYSPDPGDEAPEGQRLAYQADREVRHTVIRVIGAHLREGATTSWRGADLDFTAVRFDGGDFGDSVFSGGRVRFDRAQFSGGHVSFIGAEFCGGDVSFSGAEFCGGDVSFVVAKFCGGRVRFDRAKFSGGDIWFGRAEFSSSEVSFAGAKFSGGWVAFGSAQFCGSRVSFDGAEFSGGEVSFAGAQFSGSWVPFAGAKFSGGLVSFGGAKFSSGWVWFAAEFSGGEVPFIGAEFSGGQVGFSGAKFSGSAVSFADTEFPAARSRWMARSSPAVLSTSAVMERGPAGRFSVSLSRPRRTESCYHPIPLLISRPTEYAVPYLGVN